MITMVIKRDGTSVPFDVNKLNKWGEWAANNQVSWSDVVFKAMRKLTEGCSTEDIIKALIDACLDNNSYEHSKMAARLLVGDIYKEVFGSFVELPLLLDFYDDMVTASKWKDMGYTPEELIYLEDVIDHSKDFNYEFSTVKQVSERYALKDVKTGKLFESLQFTYMGVALAACSIQPLERRLEDVCNMYEALSDLKINAPTPTLSQLRTDNNGLASCCLFTNKDTSASIEVATHIAYTMTCANSGIGGYLNTRSLGDGVRNNTIEHTGKLPYYRYLEAAVKSTKQSSRGGAATIYFTCLDPEMEDLTRLKHPTTPVAKQIRGMDYGVMMNKYFMEKVAKNEDWMLISIQNAPDLFKLFFSEDIEGFKAEYNRVYESGVSKKTINARELALAIEKQYYETGRVYSLMVDEANRHTPFKEAIYSSNLCVAPETLVLTDAGNIPISDLEDQIVNVWNGEEFTETQVRKTGHNQKLLKVVTDSGQEVECTPYHKFYTQPKYNGKLVMKRAHELVAGDKLIKFDLPVIQGEKVLAKAYQNGFYTADGCNVKGRARIYLYGEKRNLRDFFDLHPHTVQEEQDREYGYELGLKDKFFVPDATYTLESRLDWLAGWLDGDGSIYHNGTNQQVVGSSIEKEFLKEVQLMLQATGVESKIQIMSEAGERNLPLNDGSGENGLFYCQESYRLIINSNGLFKLHQLGITFNRLKSVARLPQRKASHFIKVVNVIDEGRVDDTYCFTEAKRGMGMFNGLLTGNCAEILLPTEGYTDVSQLYGTDIDAGEVALCFIAAIAVGRVTPEEYEKIAYYAAMLVDNTMELTSYPFNQVKLTAQARRSMGIGITNLADAMAVKGVSYSSQDGKQYIHDLAEMHSFYLHKASLRLAKEKGNAEWMHKTKYPDGWLPIDTYNKNVDNVVSGLKMDWEGLRKEIIKQGGIRNSVLEATMPAETSSQASNTTNSVYPIRDLVITKASGKSKIPCYVPHYGNLMIRIKYEKAYDVPYNDIVDMYALVQKFHGQSISADFYFDPSKYPNRKIGAKEQLQRLLYMAKMGMKSRYYMNTKTESGKEIEDSPAEGCSSGGCTL
jgi:ribonucleoside-diphosphate reductase alpha chain